MATWSLRTGEKIRECLTLYELEELAVRGRLGPNDALRDERWPGDAELPWRPIADVPWLYRQLSASPRPPPEPAPLFPAESGATGKPLPFSDSHIEALLSSESGGPDRQRLHQIATGLRLFAVALLAAEACILLRAIVTSP